MFAIAEPVWYSLETRYNELFNMMHTAPQRETQSGWSLELPLLWRYNGHGSVSNHQPHDCLLNRLFRRRSKKTSKLRVTGLCVGNSPVTGEFPAQMASNAENASIWWRHHAKGASRFADSVWSCNDTTNFISINRNRQQFIAFEVLIMSYVF